MDGIFYEEQDVTLASLSLILERATIAAEACKDKSLYVYESGMFPFWIEIRERPKFIYFYSYLNCSPEADDAAAFELCNRVNKTIYVPQVHIADIEVEGQDPKKRLYASYPLYYRDGLVASQLIRICRLFSDGMKRVEREFDPNEKVVIHL